MRGACSTGVVGLAMGLGLGLWVTPALAGLGEMDVGFGFDLFPRATSGNLQVCSASECEGRV